MVLAQQCLPVLQSDDRVIKEEGLDNLTDDELRGACRSRGMRTPYGEGAVVFMRKQLQEWLDLSLNRCLIGCSNMTKHGNICCRLAACQHQCKRELCTSVCRALSCVTLVPLVPLN